MFNIVMYLNYKAINTIFRYTVFLTLKCASKLDCNTQPVVYSFQTTSAGVVVPSPSSNQPLGQTSVIAIAVSGGVIILCLLLVIVFFVSQTNLYSVKYSLLLCGMFYLIMHELSTWHAFTCRRYFLKKVCEI